MIPSKVHHVVLPLKVDELKDLIEKKDFFYIVDYRNSQLRDAVMLNYISNLDLPCELKIDSTLDYEERTALLKAYMSSKHIVKVKSLAINLMQILLENRGIDTSEMIEKPLLNKEEVKAFISANKEIVERWEKFVESTIIFAMFTAKDLDTEVKIKDQVPVIDDPNFIGSNVVNLFSIPSFTEQFFTKPIKHELSFFRPQFEDDMYKGRNLYSFFFCEENEIYNLFSAQIYGGITADMLTDAVKEAYQVVSNKS